MRSHLIRLSRAVHVKIATYTRTNDWTSTDKKSIEIAVSSLKISWLRLTEESDQLHKKVTKKLSQQIKVPSSWWYEMINRKWQAKISQQNYRNKFSYGGAPPLLFSRRKAILPLFQTGPETFSRFIRMFRTLIILFLQKSRYMKHWPIFTSVIRKNEKIGNLQGISTSVIGPAVPALATQTTNRKKDSVHSQRIVREINISLIFISLDRDCLQCSRHL